MTQNHRSGRTNRVLKLAGKLGLIRGRDVEAEGIPREYLRRLWKRGELERVGRGLYTLPGKQVDSNIALAEVAKRVPRGVVCLLSALQFHGLTTQSPHRVWVAIENRHWEPKLDYPPLELVRFTGPTFNYGVEIHRICKVPVRVYNPAKTVADCFKFRNKIGLEVALEALRETWSSRKATMDEMWEAAKVCRVAKVIRPYLESMT